MSATVTNRLTNAIRNPKRERSVRLLKGDLKNLIQFAEKLRSAMYLWNGACDNYEAVGELLEEEFDMSESERQQARSEICQAMDLMEKNLGVAIRLLAVDLCRCDWFPQRTDE
jgi:hypothetical protein